LSSEEYYLLQFELKKLIDSLHPDLFHNKLSKVDIKRERIIQLIEAIQKSAFQNGELIDVFLFLLQHLLPDEYQRLVVTEHIDSSFELYEFNPVKNGQNIVKHGVSFTEVVSYSKRFGTLLVPCSDEQDKERFVIFSDLSIDKNRRKLVFPLPKIEQQTQCYVISIVQIKEDGKFRFISSRVMSRKRHKKTLKNALKNIYNGQPEKKNDFLEECLKILDIDLFRTA